MSDAQRSVAVPACHYCGAVATLSTTSWGALLFFCAACGVPNECTHCNEVPNARGRCDCDDGVSKLAEFKPL